MDKDMDLLDFSDDDFDVRKDDGVHDFRLGFLEKAQLPAAKLSHRDESAEYEIVPWSACAEGKLLQQRRNPQSR